MNNIFINILMWGLGAVSCVVFIGMLGLAVRQIIALCKKDELEFTRLTTPYEIAEMEALRDFKVPSKIFQKYWDSIKDEPGALPYDAYLLIKRDFEKK